MNSRQNSLHTRVVIKCIVMCWYRPIFLGLTYPFLQSILLLIYIQITKAVIQGFHEQDLKRNGSGSAESLFSYTIAAVWHLYMSPRCSSVSRSRWRQYLCRILGIGRHDEASRRMDHNKFYIFTPIPSQVQRGLKYGFNRIKLKLFLSW